MKESEFWNNIIGPKLQKFGVFERIENAVGNGTADVSYACQGTQGWIETKITKGGFLYFERFQPAWIKARLRHCHHIFVLSYSPGTRVIRLFHGTDVVDGHFEPYQKWLRLRYDTINVRAILHKPYDLKELVEYLA